MHIDKVSLYVSEFHRLPHHLGPSLKQSVELGERPQRQSVGQRRLGVFSQHLRPLSGSAAAVTRHQEAGQDGAQEERHQDAGDQKCVVDVSADALVHVRKLMDT